MKKFKELVSLCKCSVEISVNDHKDVYENVEQYLTDAEKTLVDKDVLSKMIELDTIVRVQAYPHNPIGCFIVYHYDIDEALDIVVKGVKNEL